MDTTPPFAAHIIKTHFVNGRAIMEDGVPGGVEYAVFGMGCFWGPEKLFWEFPGVYSTAVGYCGGHKSRPTYEEVCTGSTGHAEAVLVFYDEGEMNYERLLQLFWENHDPTQGMRQGNDRGSQYRSIIFTQNEEERIFAEATRDMYQCALKEKGFGPITTEITDLHGGTGFHYAEDYHQQYLAKNPGGYCGLGGTGVCLDLSFPRNRESREKSTLVLDSRLRGNDEGGMSDGAEAV